MQSNLDLFRAQLDKDHEKVVLFWKKRYRKSVIASSLLFVSFLAFSGMYFGLDSERAGLVAMVLAALCVAQGWALTRDEYEWGTSLVEAGRCSSYLSLLARNAGKTQAFEIRHRPIYMADFLALQDYVDALEDASFDSAERDAAKWLGQSGKDLAGASQS